MTPMKTRPFKQVDVFTATPYSAIRSPSCSTAPASTTRTMQRFARWTNLSETTFLLPPTEPSRRLPRAHLHAGRRAALRRPSDARQLPCLAAGRRRAEGGGPIVQQCARRAWCRSGTTANASAFAAPPLRRSAPSPSLLAKVAAALGLKAQQIVAAQVLDNGPGWLGLLLDGADTVLALKPDHRMLQGTRAEGRRRRHPATDDAPPLIARSNREARAFARSDDEGSASRCAPSRRRSASRKTRSPAASTPAWRNG